MNGKVLKDYNQYVDILSCEWGVTEILYPEHRCFPGGGEDDRVQGTNQGRLSLIKMLV